jgi:elongation factor G
MTQGKGFFQMNFDRYEQVPGNIASEIIAKHQPAADKD